MFSNKTCFRSPKFYRLSILQKLNHGQVTESSTSKLWFNSPFNLALLGNKPYTCIDLQASLSHSFNQHITLNYTKREKKTVMYAYMFMQVGGQVCVSSIREERCLYICVHEHFLYCYRGYIIL